MRKILTEPLFLFFVWVFITLLFFRKKNKNSKLLRVIFFPLIFLYLFSMPITARILEKTVFLDPKLCTDAKNEMLDAIVVLSASYIHGATPEKDLLRRETLWRLMYGVEWWKDLISKQKKALFVVSGTTPNYKDRSEEHESMLMAKFALFSGIPQANIRYDTKGATTWDEAVNVAKLPGFSRKTKIGLATSAWHMRRSLREFKKYFDNVVVMPYCESDDLSLSIKRFLPQANALHDSTSIVHEWIGLVWYYLRSL